MNKAFHMAPEIIHVDICLESGVIIDLGNNKLRVIHTPGHCSGCICIYEEKSSVVFTGDTVLADGIITGIFPSGSISDYINSLNKLLSFRINALFPGHGKISNKPYDDLNTAKENAIRILNNSRLLFNTLNTKKSFETIFKTARKFSLPK
jgi:glyoxylase-like metal-dependent hydrolase (beta-lactamase superfamily II)